jgi:hypothetical protein
MDHAPKRRWFQFRLRTLLIGFSLLCAIAICGYGFREAKIASDRRSLLAGEWCDQATPGPDGEQLSFIRRWLGDKPILRIDLNPLPPEDVVKRYRSAFPEAKIAWASHHPAAPVDEETEQSKIPHTIHIH